MLPPLKVLLHSKAKPTAATHQKKLKGASRMNEKIYSTNSINDRMHFIKDIFDFDDLSGQIEVRELKNGEEPQIKFWKDWEDIESYDPPPDRNVYVGMLTREQHGSGGKDNCKHGRVIWADYDGMDKIEVEFRINMTDLPQPSMMINSGGGVHAYWILNEAAPGPEIEPVVQKVADITEGDGQVAHYAAIMRLPGTLNVKDKYEKPRLAEIIEINNKRYNLKDLAEAAGAEIGSDKAQKPDNRLNVDWETVTSNIRRPCIESMLNGVEEGARNFATGRLTMYFRNIRGYKKDKTKRILLYWNSRFNDPPQNERELLNSFKKYWLENYNLLGCKIPDNSTKQAILNRHCDKRSCDHSGIDKVAAGKTTAHYNNRMIREIYKFHGTTLVIYGILEMNMQGLTMDRIGEISGYSRPTVSNRLEDLKHAGFIKRIENKKGKDLFRVKKQGTYGTGRTAVNYGAVKLAAAGELSPTEFKVYLLLWWFYWIGKSEKVFPSTYKIAEKLRTSQQAAHQIIKALEKKDYIDIDKTEENHNIYILKV